VERGHGVVAQLGDEAGAAADEEVGREVDEEGLRLR
jgi:hypothetical protein